MIPYNRSDRVGGLVQKVLSDVLQQRIKDPRLKMITITGVRMSQDLKVARIYFVASGGKKRTGEAVEGFKSAIGYIKRTLASRLNLRYMPELKFYYDQSFDYGSKIDQLLNSVMTKHGSDHIQIEK